MKRVFKYWLWLSALPVILFFSLNWVNHPVLPLNRHHGELLSLLLVLPVWFVRRYLFNLPGAYWKGAALFILTAWFLYHSPFIPPVPASGTARAMALLFLLAIILPWLACLGLEEIGKKLDSVFKGKKPAWLGALVLAAVGGAFIGYWSWHASVQEKRFALWIGALYLLTALFGLARAYLLKVPPAYLYGSLAVFSAYQILSLYSPDFLRSYNASLFFYLHLALSVLVYLFWEKLIQPRSRTFLYFLVFGLLVLFPAFYIHTTVWLGHLCLLLVIIAWGKNPARFLPGKKTPQELIIDSIAPPVRVQEAADTLGRQANDMKKAFLDCWKRNPQIQWAVMGLVLAVLVGTAGRSLYGRCTTHIISFTPVGIVSSANTVLRATFSADVSVSGKLDNTFQVDPPLPGTTRLEGSNTLVFTPAAPLKPATAYRVKLNTSGLKSKQLFLQGSAKTSFTTEPLKVSSCRLFYTFDLVKDTEKELMGELEFNYPVPPGLLKENLSVSREGAKLEAELEPGTLPTRFFFKAGGLQREETEQVLKVVLGSGLSCVDCGRPMGERFEKTIKLPAKPKLTVENLKLHHVPGNSTISIRFTLPVSSGQVKDNVSIEPSLPFKVETEYCYAVLRAEFEPNQEYKVRVREGLRAISGETLEKKYETTLKLEDIHPYVKFADEGRLIPLEGGKVVAVNTMNLDAYTVEVQKVFRNNLVDYLHRSSGYPNYYQRHNEYRGYSRGEPDEDESGGGEDYSREPYYLGNLGVSIWSGAVTVEGGEINQEAKSSLDFAKWHKAPYKGLFVLTLEGANDGGRAVRSFLCSDLGLMMKYSGGDLWVQVLSISKLTPAAGVRVQLVSDNNQTIQQGETDEAGRIWFRNWKNNPYDFTPYVIVAQLGDDWSYLRLDQSTLNQSRFDVGGDPFESQGWDAFLASDRGLYRPGEQANFTAVVRHADLKTPQSLPVNLTIRDSSGNQVAKMVSRLREFGMTTFRFDIREETSTGRFTAELGLENGVQLATTTIKVEQFIPNKIKVEVKPLKRTAAPGESLSFQVVARQLFGAAGAELKARATVKISALEFMDKNWKSYRFSDHTREFANEYIKIPDGITDASGVLSVQLPIPPSLLPPSMMRAEVYAEVLDSGGRPVGANASIQVHKYPYYLGLKCLEGKGASTRGQVHVRYVAITPEGKPTSVKKVMLIVKRKVWYSLFHKSGWKGRHYDSSSYEQVIEGKEIDIDGKGEYTFKPDKPGEYTIYLGNENSMRSSILVPVTGPEGNRGQAANLEDPDKLSLSLNKKEYKVGESPRLEVRAPFSGQLVVTLEREKVFYSKTLLVEQGLNVVELPPVESDYLPNIYAVGLLVRKPEAGMRSLPMASFGITPLAVNTSSREITYQWKPPESVKSRQGIHVDLDTGAPGTKVVLAAVDEGILDIISFVTPDPFKHFYRKRGLSTSTLSLYEEILPDLNRKQALGGDEGEGFGFRHLNPLAAKRVKSYALFSGILTAGENGRVKYFFPTDKFHGEVRIMVLGVKENKFGAAAYRVRVADPVVVDPSFPRFLAPGDHFDVPVLLYNNTKAAQKIHLRVTSKGPAQVEGAAEQDVTLGPEGQQQVLFHAEAESEAGIAKFKVTAAIAKGESFDVETELSVRPGNPLSTSVEYGSLGPGKEKELSVPGGFIPQGQRIRLSVSSSPLLTFLRSLDYLVQYPYGCAEQKTSQGFPLLYFKSMGLLTGRFSGRANAVEMFVQDAVDDLCKMQLSDGSFALWPGDQEGPEYLANYVSHFLILAKKEGYRVNQEVMDKILNRLGAIQVRGKGVGRLDRRKQNVEIQNNAYVLYLKALADRADVESMAAMKAKIKERSAADRCLLSLSYSELGDRSTALAVLPPKYLPGELVRQMNGEWFSPNKEMALYLMALAEADPRNGEIPNLIKEFGKRLKDGHFGTTQEDAWTFIALGKAIQASTGTHPLNAQWRVKGGAPKALTGETAVVKDEKLSGEEIQLKNLGDQEIYFHLLAEGTQLESKKESVSNGLRVEREYRDEKGVRINLDSVAQGDLVVVTLRVTCSKELDNLVIVDLLPAGFEVDNPRLSSRGKLGFDLECNFSPAYRDFRDDRVLLFSRNVSGELAFSYSVRAVTPGSFQVPGLTAEAMYDPDIFGRSNTGENLVIAPAKY